MGEVYTLDRSIEGFHHILKRIYDDHYIIPYKFNNERLHYDVRPLNLDDELMIEINNSGRIYHLSSKVLMKSPKFKQLLVDYESIPPLQFPVKGFKQLISALMNHAEVLRKPFIMAEEKYKSIFNWAEIIPDLYYTPIYYKCEKCLCIIKTKQFKDDDKEYCYTHITCRKHRCDICNFSAEGLSKYCKFHKCGECSDQIINGKTTCKKHLENMDKPKGYFW